MEVQEQINLFLQIPEIKKIFSEQDIHWNVAEYSQGWYFEPTVPDYEKGYFLGAWETWQAKAQAVPKINDSIQAHELTISEIKAEIEEGYDLCQDIYLLDALVERGVQIGKILAVPEGFVLVPKELSIDAIKNLDDEFIEVVLKDDEDYQDIYKAMIEAQEQSHD